MYLNTNKMANGV